MALGRGEATLQGACGEGVGMGVPGPLARLWICLFSQTNLQCWRFGDGALWEPGSVLLSVVPNLLKQFLFTFTAGSLFQLCGSWGSVLLSVVPNLLKQVFAHFYSWCLSPAIALLLF